MTIGQLAKRTGVSVATIRFYESKGILQEPQRSTSGYRQYSSEDCATIDFILRAKQFGFTLKEIQYLLFLGKNTKSDCGQVKKVLQKKESEIQSKISFLQDIRQSLHEMEGRCRTKQSVLRCPFLTPLQKQK